MAGAVTAWNTRRVLSVSSGSLSPTARPCRRARPATTVAVLVAAALLATGCSTDDSPPQPPTPTPREVPTGAEDRDADTMLHAVAALDPCALLDEDVTTAHGWDPDLTRGQFTCEVPDEVEVTLYQALGTEARFWQDRIALGGAIAYRDSPALDWCTISLPISFTHVITFGQIARSEAQRDCDAVEDYAAAAAERLLADPTALRREDLRDAVVACDLLAEIVEEVPEGATLRPGTYYSTIGECGVWENPDEHGFQAVEPLVNLELHLGPPLSEWGAGGGWEDEERMTIAGTEVLVWGEDEQCTLRFDAWQASTGEVMGADLTAAPCDEAVAMAERAIPIFANGSGLDVTADAIVYAEGEPDSTGVGACIHAVSQQARECAPTVDAEIPDDPTDLVALGALDPNVVCAAATPAVRDLLGDDLQPVTILRTQDVLDTAPPVTICEFVRVDHALTVRVRTAPEDLGYGDDGTVADHPAMDIDGNADTQLITQVALGDGTEPGLIEVEMLVTPDRSQGLYDVSPIDRTPLESFDELVERLAVDLLG